MGIIRLTCPHCRRKLGQYAYATDCPHCRRELEHNRKCTELPERCLLPVKMFILLAGGVGIGCGPVLVLAFGVVPDIARNMLFMAGTGIAGALIGGIIGLTVARYSREAKRQTAAFLASFRPRKRKLPSSAEFVSAALPIGPFPGGVRPLP